MSLNLSKRKPRPKLWRGRTYNTVMAWWELPDGNGPFLSEDLREEFVAGRVTEQTLRDIEGVRRMSNPKDFERRKRK
jgi:hypothetical protein